VTRQSHLRLRPARRLLHLSEGTTWPGSRRWVRDWPNPTAGGILGATIYECTCNRSLAKNYPLAFGPRLRDWLGSSCRKQRSGPVLALPVAERPRRPPERRARRPAIVSPRRALAIRMTLAGGVPSASVLPWPNLPTGAYPNPNFPAALSGPTSVVDQNAGRAWRQIQWSAGIQRELY
jgi:hypothetical protein